MEPRSNAYKMVAAKLEEKMLDSDDEYRVVDGPDVPKFRMGRNNKLIISNDPALWEDVVTKIAKFIEEATNMENRLASRKLVRMLNKIFVEAKTRK